MVSPARLLRSFIPAGLCVLSFAVPSLPQTFTEEFLRGLEKRDQRELEEKKLETQRQLEQQRIDIERQRLQLERQELQAESPADPVPGRPVEGLFLTSVMTREEIDSTGFASLSANQQRALNSWVLNYYFRLAETVSNKYGSTPALTYQATGRTHTLADKTANGGVLILEDQTIWSVEEVDRAVSKAWKTSARIMLLQASSSGNGAYSVVSLDDGQNVTATCLKGPAIR